MYSRQKQHPRYIFKDGRLIKVEETETERIIPPPEEAVKRGIQNAPHTILGLLGGGIVGGLIAGPPGALILGIIGGWVGFNADLAEEG